LEDYKAKLGSDFVNQTVVWLVFMLAEFLWMGIGLFSYNWWLFLGYMIFTFAYGKLNKARVKKYKSVYMSHSAFNLVLGMIVILFAIINTFHLHIDLIKLIFGS
jgi:hypothetical protein